MEFRLTYEGKLLAHRDDDRLRERSLHVHDIRKAFHCQIKQLWLRHPTLIDQRQAEIKTGRDRLMIKYFKHDGFNWLPIVTEENGLICKLDILMLREGRPGKVVYDLDNRVKTIFDALRKAKSTSELGIGTKAGLIGPSQDEDPFYVLLEDDSLITHVAVTTDNMLAPVANTTPDDAARLVITVSVVPYRSHMSNLHYV